MENLPTTQQPYQTAPGQESRTLWVVKTLFLLALFGTGIAFAFLGGVFWYFSRDLPRLFSVEDYKPWTVSQVYAGAGKEPELVGEFFEERRYLIPFEKIPEKLTQAFVAAEDDQFFNHPGINLVSIIRASLANFRAGHTVQGGSTITQQVVKSLLLTPEKSYTRKIKEIILSSQIEKNLTKNQILFLYLNQIYLGHGAYGVQAASQTYFRKDVSQLSLAEAALLAGLPQAPSKYSPVSNPESAKRRQKYVLQRMVENKFITPADFAQAAAESVKIYSDEDINPKYNAFYVEQVRRYLVEKYGKDVVLRNGLVVTIPTTRELARVAHQSLQVGLREVDKRIGYRGPLKHLRNSADIEAELRQERTAVFEHAVSFRIMTKDGVFDLAESRVAAGFKTDAEMLLPGEEYEGVVMGIDDKKKTAAIVVGGIRTEMPWTGMAWAKTAREDRTYSPPPQVPSRVLTKGDVVLVRVAQNDSRGIVVNLEQHPQVEGALLSLEVQTGNVQAMEGGYDFEDTQFNRAMQALRQPGSSFKPIIFSAALEHGYTPATIIVDSPLVFTNEETGTWKPSNFEEKFYGDTTFRQALIKSRNIPTVKIVQSIQIPTVISYARKIGLVSQYPMDLSISLGSTTVSLLELTKTYTIFPRLGRKVEPIFITRVLDRNGATLEEHLPKPLPKEIRIPAVTAAQTAQNAQAPTPGSSGVPTISINGVSGLKPIALPSYPPVDDPDFVMDPRVAYVMTNLMKEVVAYGTGHEAKNLGRPAAGKTGTTNDSIDAWFMGFTPTVSTGVWVGFDKQRPINSNETGARAALPIWLSYMKEAVKKYPEEDFSIPQGVVFATIDPVTGKLTAPNSAQSIKEAFIEGTEPTGQITPGSNSARPDTPADFFKEDL